jgi:hypothetical protein
MVPLDKNPRYLGLYHDALNMYHKNADAAKVKASRGRNKEILIAT